MRSTWIALILLSLGAATWAAEGTQKVATVEGVTEYRLANGARVVLYPEQSRDSVTVNMTVLVGSRHEGYGEAGMAHLLEHMVFKGTPTHPMVPKALRDHGANFNGTTNFDRTNYFETLRATDENLEFAIRLESDRLVNSYVKREDLLSEMTVVRNEFEIGENSPAGVLMERIHAAAYAWHNYAKTTIGNRVDIERVPIENLQDFYKKYYQPDNCVLIVAGKFDEPKALELCEKYLGAIPKPARKLNAAYTEEPPQDGERTVFLRRVGTVGSVGVAYHMPSASHPDWAPLSILGGIVSQSPNGRLYKAIVESKLATNASARAGNNHDPSLFIGNASAEPEKLNAVRDALVNTLETLAETPFTQEEVDRARVRNKRADEMLQSNAQAMSQALSSSAALGDWRLHFVQRDRIAAVTADDVNRVAKTYFQKANRTVGIYTPEKTANRVAIAAAPPIESIVKDYKGGTVTAAGEAFDATPANLDKRLKVVEEGGIKAGLLPKKNRGETVSLVVTLHYGNEESLKGLSTAAGMMPGLMMAGTKKHDRQALREELDALGVVISPGAGGFGGGRGPRRGGGGGGGALGQLTFSVQAKKDTLSKALTLLGEILREPAFPESEFETQKARMRQGMAGATTEPGTLARNRLDRALSPYEKDDVRYVPTIEESIARSEAVTLEQVKAVYEQVSASKVELAVVGDFDADETLAKVKEMLGGWAAKTPVRRIERKAPREVPGSKEEINTPDKANATYLAGLAFPLKESDEDYAALRLGNVILGGSTLASRLGDRIRQKEGLSYGATSSITAASQDPVASLTVSVNTNPANMQRVDVCVAEELEKFVKEGPSLAELTDAKNAFLEAAKVGRTTDAAIAGTIVSHLNLGRTFAYDLEQEKRIEALTLDAVKAAYQKHIDPKKLVIIRAGDFKK